MQSKTFIKLLRKLIREEVRNAVRTEMRSMLSESKPHEQVINQGVAMHNKVEQRAKKQYVKNEMLNDLLNETSALPADEYATMNFRSEMAQAFGQSPSVAPMTDINGSPVDMANENVATVVDAMTKAYSALMKAIDKKKGK